MEPEVKKKIDDVHKEIYGNGSSKNSLITRIATLESSMRILATFTVSQFFLLIGIAFKIFTG